MLLPFEKCVPATNSGCNIYLSYGIALTRGREDKYISVKSWDQSDPTR